MRSALIIATVFISGAIFAAVPQAGHTGYVLSLAEAYVDGCATERIVNISVSLFFFLPFFSPLPRQLSWSSADTSATTSRNCTEWCR